MHESGQPAGRATPVVARPVLSNAHTRQSDAAFERLQASFAGATLAPLAGAAAIAGVFFLILYLVFSPGYWINDDLKAIWALVGYPLGTGPIPFFIHSNVILGFALDALYGLPTQLNWAMILYAIINALSVWMLLYLMLGANVSAGAKLLGATILLGVLGIPTIRLTYTFTAALSRRTS